LHKKERGEAFLAKEGERSGFSSGGGMREGQKILNQTPM
jgi:hypothetical protein